METLCPTSLVPNSNWIIHHGLSTPWTIEENKKFESALAIFDDKTPNRWFHVAAMIPGKSVYDVMNQYRVLVKDVTDIDAGLVPVPGYMSSPFTLELADDNRRFDAFRKKGSINRTTTMTTTTTTTHYSDQDRKKGVPWTEEEHRRFLLGLQKHGKGDWRNISRNFVISKTPTQVASHAQKYYLRQLAGGKDKRRPSIHDITTVDLTNNINNNAKEAGAHNNNINNKPNELISSARVRTLSDSWNLHHNVTMSEGGANMMVFDSPHPNAIASRYIVNF